MVTPRSVTIATMHGVSTPSACDDTSTCATPIVLPTWMARLPRRTARQERARPVTSAMHAAVVRLKIRKTVRRDSQQNHLSPLDANYSSKRGRRTQLLFAVVVFDRECGCALRAVFGNSPEIEQIEVISQATTELRLQDLRGFIPRSKLRNFGVVCPWHFVLLIEGISP